MAIEPKVMQAIETLQYRATVGDVAAQAGLRIPVAEQGLLALASEVGGHLQVADSGEIAYTFPQNFRSILFGKYWRLRLNAWLGKAWKILFYLIRISFGLILILSIGILAIALVIAAFAALSATNRDDNDSPIRVDGLFEGIFDLLGGAMRLLFYADWLGWGGYSPGYRTSPQRFPRRSSPSRQQPKSNLNFLEAVFSFLFGDGNPNVELENHRWQAIAQVIRKHQGAIAAEQVQPFLDQTAVAADDAILPVLVQFQGQPLVSPTGALVYKFPDLQVTAQAGNSTPALEGQSDASSAFLKERPWRFSQATSGQLWAAGMLGAVNAGLAVIVGLMLSDFATSGIGFLGFVAQIYPLLLIYGVGFLLIPLIRWQVVKWRDRGVQQRNEQRRAIAQQLKSPSPELREKLTYAQTFGMRQQLNPEDAVYTTETDLIEQEVNQPDRLDEEWERRLQSG